MKNLDRNQIKWIAIVLMTCNHIGTIFLAPKTLLYEVFVNAGYMTAITMCYFLVEGVRYTRSMKRYGLRLLILAVVSQLPFDLAMTTEGILRFNYLNMGTTLLICFLICAVYLRWQKPEERGKRFLVIAALVLASGGCDWAFLAPLFTILFLRAGVPENAGRRDKELWYIYAACAVLFSLINFQGLTDYDMPVRIASSLGSGAALLFSGFLILHCYSGQSGRRSQWGKYFFYIYYPAHLLILGLIRITIR